MLVIYTCYEGGSGPPCRAGGGTRRNLYKSGPYRMFDPELRVQWKCARCKYVFAGNDNGEQTTAK